MKNLIALFLCLPLLVGASSAACQSTSAASASPQTAAAGNLQLTPVKQARKLGFDESVLRAIEQAHRQIAATPKP